MCATTLHHAVVNCKPNILRILLDRGADIAGKDVLHGWSALHQAVYVGNKAAVELFLAHGADINLRSTFGETPFHVAATLQSEDMTSFLLQKGVDITIRDSSGMTALHQAVNWKRAHIVRLLLRHPQSHLIINTQDHDGRTALHAAATHYDHIMDTAIPELLLSNGADVSIRTKSGQTALHYASAHGRYPFVQMLLEKASDRGIANIQDKTGSTALHWLMRANHDIGSGHQEVMSLLLYSGVDIKIRDNNGVAAVRTDLSITGLMNRYWTELWALGRSSMEG
jgi:ankyrin repeat protein